MNIQFPDGMVGLVTELVQQCEGANGAARFDAFKLWLKSVASRILEHLHDVALGPVKRFNAAEKFTKSNSKVQFWDFGDNFVTNFGKRIETGIAAATIAVNRLERRAKKP